MPEKLIRYGRSTHIREVVGSSPTSGTILGAVTNFCSVSFAPQLQITTPTCKFECVKI